MNVIGLDLADHLAVQRLKYLRQRSMRNPAWRDARHLGLLIERRYLQWADDTPLESQRRSVERALDTYRAAVKIGCADTEDARWGDVRSAVDQLIDGVEKVAGHLIKPRAH